MVEHYTNESVKCKSAIIGSMNILGNPVKLIREIRGKDDLGIDSGFKISNRNVRTETNTFSRGIKQ